jgi:hypothetical protein
MKPERYCVDCGRKLYTTTNYCLMCLSKHTVRKSRQVKDVGLEAKQELNELKFNSDIEVFKRARTEDLMEEYMETLKKQPILFTELSISSGRFKDIIRELRYKFYNVHVFKFKLNHTFEGVVWLPEHKTETVIRIKNLYPELRIPKFMK